MKDEVVDFYDDFTKKQLEKGINNRHLSIRRWLRKLGLRKGCRVLEIGCGIGTVTELIVGDVGASGSVVAMDISPKSIEIAMTRFAGYPNLSLIAADATDYDFESKFDVIVLPDVIEHIPLELHSKLFKKLESIVEDDGNIVIHIPNPYYLEWVHANRPEVLQVIDQPVFTDLLVENTYPNGLYIHSLQNYCLCMDKSDYQVVELRKRPAVQQYSVVKSSLSEKFAAFPGRVVRKLSRMMRAK